MMKRLLLSILLFLFFIGSVKSQGTYTVWNCEFLRNPDNFYCKNAMVDGDTCWVLNGDEMPPPDCASHLVLVSYFDFDSALVREKVDYRKPLIRHTWWYRNGNKMMEVIPGKDPDDYTERSYSPNGKIQSEYKGSWIVPGNFLWPAGPWTEWYETGEKKAEGYYKDNKKDGVETQWYRNGQVMQTITYRDGKKEGHWARWDYNGIKCFEGDYKDDKPEGSWTVCHQYVSPVEIENTLVGRSFKDVRCWNFAEGLAEVMNGSLCGYMNREGKLVIPMIYDMEGSDDFSDSLVRVCVNGKWALMDHSGKLITPLKYDAMGYLYDKEIRVEWGQEKGYLQHNGKETITPHPDCSNCTELGDGYFSFTENGKYGLLGPGKKIIVPAGYYYLGYHGPGVFMAEKEKNGPYVFMDKKGNVFEAELKPYGTCETGMTRGEKNGKYSYMDVHGKMITDSLYDDLRDFSEGFAFMLRGGKWGAIDTSGKEVIPFIYDNNVRDGWGEGWKNRNSSYYQFRNGHAEVRLNGKWGIIDKRGKTTVPFRYDELRQNMADYYDAELAGRKGMIDWHGRIVLPLIFDQVDFEDDFNKEVVKVKIGKRHGIYSIKGKEIVMTDNDSTQFRVIDELIYISKGDKEGVMDMNGKFIIPMIFDYISYFGKDGLSAAGLNGRQVFIDKKGTCVLWCD